MRLHFTALALLLTISGSALSQDELPPARENADDAAPADVPEDVQKCASYAVGYEFGQNVNRVVKEQSLPILFSAVIQGLSDALDGKEPAFSPDEMRDATTQIQRSTITRLAKKNKAEGDKFLASNAKKRGVVTLDSGLQYEVLKKGNGPSPGATDKVRTHYHGTLLDGTVFDSSVNRGEPLTFGVNEVIAGWTEALQLMKVGDKWRLWIPSDLAYGVNGAPGIAPNSVLVFEVELLGIER